MKDLGLCSEIGQYNNTLYYIIGLSLKLESHSNAKNFACGLGR